MWKTFLKTAYQQSKCGKLKANFGVFSIFSTNYQGITEFLTWKKIEVNLQRENH
jgi:hypothetical protein